MRALGSHPKEQTNIGGLSWPGAKGNKLLLAAFLVLSFFSILMTILQARLSTYSSNISPSDVQSLFLFQKPGIEERPDERQESDCFGRCRGDGY